MEENERKEHQFNIHYWNYLCQSIKRIIYQEQINPSLGNGEKQLIFGLRILYLYEHYGKEEKRNSIYIRYLWSWEISQGLATGAGLKKKETP
jgi:hypothetical protein